MRSIRATSGPASAASRTSGRAAYSETVAGVRLQGSLSATHAGTCRDTGADPEWNAPSATDVQDAEAYGRTRSGFEQRFEGTAADPFRLCGGQGGDPKTNASPAFGPNAARQSSAKR